MRNLSQCLGVFFLKLLTYRRNWRSYRPFGTIDEKNSWRIWELSESKTHSRENLVSQQLQRETVAVLESVNVMESTHAFLTGSFIHSWNIFVIFPRHDLTPASQLALRRIVLRNLEKKKRKKYSASWVCVFYRQSSLTTRITMHFPLKWALYFIHF